MITNPLHHIFYKSFDIGRVTRGPMFYTNVFATYFFVVAGSVILYMNLTADKNMAGVIIDRFGTDVWMHEAENGELSVSVEVSVSPQFFGWITAMGGKVRIAGPNDVKAEYYELLGKCMER